MTRLRAAASRRARAKVVAAAALVALGLACGPRLSPITEAAPCFADLNTTPIIAAARVDPTTNKIVGRQQHLDSPVTDLAQLASVRVQVENVFKGDLSLGIHDLYYFISGRAPTGPPKLSFYRDKPFRVLLCLRRDAGVLRVMDDFYTNCKINVFSGAHPNVGATPAYKLPETLVDFLLTPGQDASRAQMLDAIFDRGPERISPFYTAKRLLQIASTGPVELRAASCLQIRELAIDTLDLKGNDIRGWLAVPRSTVTRWQAEFDRHGGAPIADWWKPEDAPGPISGKTALELCDNDVALGLSRK